MAIQLLSIQFRNTLALRRLTHPNGVDGATHLVDRPEWKKGVSVQAADAPVAVSTRRALGHPISIVAKLRRATADPANIRIRAVDSAGGNILGAVPEHVVHFGNARTKSVALPMDAPPYSSVAMHDDQWTWEWRENATGAWMPLEITNHLVFVTLDDPHSPWSEEPVFAPWVEVLQVACDWASGASTVDEASTRITRSLYALGEPSAPPAPFGYQGSASFALTRDRFNCAHFLATVRANPPQRICVDCSDCASIVSTLANALGADLLQGRFGLDLAIRPIQLIGNAAFAPDSFGFHEVAWRGSVDEDTAIWDACLKVDQDTNPSTAPHPPLQPAGIVFGTLQSHQYAWRLVRPSSPAIELMGTGNSGSNRSVSPAAFALVLPPADRPATGKWFIWNLRDEGRILAPWKLAQTLFEFHEKDLRTYFDSTWWTLAAGQGPQVRVRAQTFSSFAQALAGLEERRQAYSGRIVELQIGDAGFGLRDLTQISFVRGNLVIEMGAACPPKETVLEKSRMIDTFLTLRGGKSQAAVDFSRLMPLSDPQGKPLWYRAFSPTGEMRAIGGKPEYIAARIGPQTVDLFTHDPSGTVTSAEHQFEVKSL